MSGGRFLSRLDDAAAEGKREMKGLSPSLKDDSASSSLLEKATEYLFDIFDANCMEEYRIINSFEERALLAFPIADVNVAADLGEGEGEEITFEQERLHNEFLGIFEELIERFLHAEGVSSASFYEQVREHYHHTQGGRRQMQAVEVVDVIFTYTDISQWHAMMMENARQRKRWEAHRQTKLQEALSANHKLGEPKKNMEKHRLDEE